MLDKYTQRNLSGLADINQEVSLQSQVSGEPPHTGLSVLPLQLRHKYTPGVEGVDRDSSSQVLLVLLQTVGQQLCKTSLYLQRWRMTMSCKVRKLSWQVASFCVRVLFFVCLERFIVKHQCCAKREKKAKQTEFIDTRLLTRPFLSLSCSLFA